MINPNLVIKNREYYRKRLRIILSHINLYNCSILDLGAGELLLREELKKVSYQSYLGVDSISFQNDAEFLCSDIFDFGILTSNKFDAVFCLGVLDHLSKSDQIQLIDICNRLYTKYLILSKVNEKNIFFRFRKQKFTIPIPNTNKKRIFLIKLPFTRQVFLLKRKSWYISLLATEVVYIFNK